MRFIFDETTNKKQMSNIRRKLSDIKYIVIHYTGNYSKGANARAHKKYLDGATRYGSAHFFVDDEQIIQTVGDSKVAWSVGDNQGHGRYLNGCNNRNSISIEMCVNSDSDQEKTYKNVLELTKNLMKRFNIDADHVCRHYDVSRKDCPHNFRENNWALWWQFKEEIKKPIEWAIDLDKNSEFGATVYVPKTEVAVVTDAENLKEQDEKRKEYLIMNAELEQAKKYVRENGISDGLNLDKQATRAEVIVMLHRTLNPNARKDFKRVVDQENLWTSKQGEKPCESKYYNLDGLHVIETTADNIEILKVPNVPLYKQSLNGINGTFYNIGKSEIYGIAIQDDKPLDTNSYVSTFNGIKRGTIWYDGNKTQVGLVYNANDEIKTRIKWAVSGIELYPNYNPSAEGFIGGYADVLRKTNHTAIGFKDNTVYLIVSKNLTLLDFRNKILNSKLAFDGLINLDGGGSTQMNFGGKSIISTTRPLNHAICVKY